MTSESITNHVVLFRCSLEKSQMLLSPWLAFEIVYETWRANQFKSMWDTERCNMSPDNGIFYAYMRSARKGLYFLLQLQFSLFLHVVSSFVILRNVANATEIILLEWDHWMTQYRKVKQTKASASATSAIECIQPSCTFKQMKYKLILWMMSDRHACFSTLCSVPQSHGWVERIGCMHWISWVGVQESFSPSHTEN